MIDAAKIDFELAVYHCFKSGYFNQISITLPFNGRQGVRGWCSRVLGVACPLEGPAGHALNRLVALCRMDTINHQTCNT